MKTNCFVPADILLPRENLEKWAVIACDQFTSDPEYWRLADEIVGDSPSSLRVILPEIYLSDDNSGKVSAIDRRMNEYLERGILENYRNSMIYVERVQMDGKIRRGIVGAVDLKKYDYHKGSKTLIRATEQTVPERLPPRIEIRKDAPLELPHIMMLIDDPLNSVIGRISAKKDKLKKLYDFRLMLDGGQVRGYLLEKEDIDLVTDALDALATGEDPLLFAVGDGNHSLAAAKECYNLSPNPLNRYALCEVVNIHDEALVFEPIYRVLFGISKERLISELKDHFGDINVRDGQVVKLISKGEECTISLPRRSALTVGTVQVFINALCAKDKSVGVDYVHEIETVRRLSDGENTVGIIFEGMKKSELFGAVINDGALPRKTFSMGEGRDKRYYIEARRIK